MTCQRYEPDIGDYVDGTLPGDARAALEGHLASCAACRALAADLRAIRAAARELPPHDVPPHVWTRLAAAFESETGARRAARWQGVFAWEPLGAVAMLVLIASGLSWVGGRLASGGGMPPAVAAARLPIDVELRRAEEQFAAAIAGLDEIRRAEQASLDPATAGVLQANLAVIDRAIDESRAALQTEPENTVARESLFDLLRSKLALLQETVALINEMRKGNQEEVARILSGLNQ
ncbi:MAG TPA: zf-HC2 domain-containing protein [Vicinamibacterales bacterium]|nr:zf-HC2 domain-containing protein [Vicinamibacterales bacterium]